MKGSIWIRHFLGELSKGLSSDIQKLEKAIFEAAGETFNLASPKQLGPILFEKLKSGGQAQKNQNGTVLYR